MLFSFWAYTSYSKRDKPQSKLNATGQRSSFLNGIIVAILNPQSIPYWIFVLAYLKSANVLELYSVKLWLFLTGVAIGKYIILVIYSYLSFYINRHISNLNNYVSKSIGGFLWLLDSFRPSAISLFPEN
ncbi:MAG: hypothetical protein U5K79_24890 [Cyclobacteriaceae bacterium]|nr:hypothetical protein [Cyclobacteriaceae bacterium]